MQHITANYQIETVLNHGLLQKGHVCNIAPFWSHFSILILVLPKCAQTLIFALISDRSCDVFWRKKIDALARRHVIYFKGQR